MGPRSANITSLKRTLHNRANHTSTRLNGRLSSCLRSARRGAEAAGERCLFSPYSSLLPLSSSILPPAPPHSVTGHQRVRRRPLRKGARTVHAGSHTRIAYQFSVLLTSYLQAIAISPSNGVFYGNRSAALFQLQRWRECAADCKVNAVYCFILLNVVL